MNPTAYRLAAEEHLAQSEAFLTLFRASLERPGDHRLASATARQLLASNRLLLDSPAARDRSTRLLLEDLELVLAEIAQLSPGSPAQDRELIREGIERGGVLSRLRKAVPAGTVPNHGVLVMFRMHVGLALAAIGTSHWWVSAPVEPAALAVQAPLARRTSPPPPWRQGDPADSLYRAAREALGRRQFDSAAALFGRLPARYPALRLRAGRLLLAGFRAVPGGRRRAAANRARGARTQRTRFPKAATKGDAAALERRIQGELARQGDPTAAVAVERAASADAAAPPVPPVPPSQSRRSGAARAARRRRRARPRRMHGKPGKDCDGDDDDTKLAALNALHADGRREGPADPAAGAGPARCRVGLPPAEGGLPDRPGEAARAPRTSCWRPRATIPIPRCGSRRCSGCRRSAPRGRSARSTRFSGARRTGRCRRRRCSRCRSTRARGPGRAPRLRRARRPARGAAGEGDLLDRPERRGGERRVPAGPLRPAQGESSSARRCCSRSRRQGAKENRRWLLGVARDATQPMELRKQALFWAGQGGVPIADLGACTPR